MAAIILALMPSLSISQVKSSQVKLYCSISGNYAHNESSQKTDKKWKEKQITYQWKLCPSES